MTLVAVPLDGRAQERQFSKVVLVHDEDMEIEPVIRRLRAELRGADIDTVRGVRPDTGQNLLIHLHEPAHLAVIQFTNLPSQMRLTLVLRPRGDEPIDTQTWVLPAELNEEVRATVIEIAERLRTDRDVRRLPAIEETPVAVKKLSETIDGEGAETNQRVVTVSLGAGAGWMPGASLGGGPSLMLSAWLSNEWALGLTVFGPQFGASFETDTGTATLVYGSLTLGVHYIVAKWGRTDVLARIGLGGLLASLSGRRADGLEGGQQRRTLLPIAEIGLGARHDLGRFGGPTIDIHGALSLRSTRVTLAGELAGQFASPLLTSSVGWFVDW